MLKKLNTLLSVLALPDPLREMAQLGLSGDRGALNDCREAAAVQMDLASSWMQKHANTQGFSRYTTKNAAGACLSRAETLMEVVNTFEDQNLS